MKEKYSKQKSSNTWSSSYSSEFIEKYQHQQQEFETERQEFEKMDKHDLKLEELDLSKSFQFGTILGRGVFTVFRSKENSSGKEFAIKVVNKKQALSLGLDPTILTRQIKILTEIKHENIIQLFRVEDNPNFLALVTELAEGEVLVKLAEKKENFSEVTARRIITQLLNAVNYLHSKDIVHFAIVPQNIFFEKETGSIKLGGFTSSQMIGKSEKEIGISGGDPAFQAPEILGQQGFGKPADLWSVGVFAFLLLSGTLPFKDNNTIRLNNKIRQGKYEFTDSEWKSVSNQGKEFVTKFLIVDTTKRPTAEKALQDNFIKGSGGNELPGVKERFVEYNQS